jgi:hypothetical protein
VVLGCKLKATESKFAGAAEGHRDLVVGVGVMEEFRLTLDPHHPQARDNARGDVENARDANKDASGHFV